jgi:ABC-type amino acid transport substrate-binding protein/signal transduction histidine kinase
MNIVNKSIKYVFVILVYISVLQNTILASNNTIFTKKERNWIKNNKIKVGVERWKPVVFINKNNKIDGITGDILSIIIKKTGLDVEYIHNDWTYLLNDFKNNKIDILPATYYTKDRATYGLFSDPYFGMKEYIYIKHSNNTIKSFDDLSDKTIAVIKDYGTIPKIKKEYPNIKIIETKDIEQSINFVLEGKVDAYIDAQIGVENYINNNVVVGIKAISQDKFDISYLHMFVDDEKKILLNIINKSLSLITQAEKNKIVSKWLYKTNIEQDKLSFLSNTELVYIKHNKTIKMCNNPNWNPIEYIDKDGKPQGIVIDILNDIEDRLNIKFEHIPTSSWSESQQFLKSKKCDILPAATETKSRKEYANFTTNYLTYRLAIITQHNKPFINSIESILDKTMSRKKGSGIISKLKAKYPNIQILETSGYEESLKKVSNGEVYYTIATLPVASHYISKFSLYNLHIAGYLDISFDLSIAIRDDKPILYDILNKTLKQIPQEDIDTIEKRWSSIKIVDNTDIQYDIILKILMFFVMIGLFFLYKQKQLQKHHLEISKQNEKFKGMLSSVMEAVILIDRNKIIDMNLSAIRLFEIDKKENIIGDDISIFFHNNFSEIDKLVSGQNAYETVLLKQNNQEFSALVKIVELENQNITVVSVLDLTELKEKEKLLSLNSKMAQMGEMLGNIAHQWRQPLSVITTAATGIRVKKEFGLLSDDELYEFIDGIKKNSEHLSSTIDIFRNFIKEKPELKTVYLEDRFDNAIDIIKPRIDNKYIELIKNINYENKILVTIVAGELTQVLINIINNSIDVLEELEIDDKWIKVDISRFNDKAVIVIEDNGGGIDDDILPKIFEPYFTTKHQSVGTGIGLYMSYDIIVNHMSGKLYASNTQYGAKFTIELPIGR